MKEVELVVIGGGAAGMAAAVSAYKNGVRDILILERNSALGGVLQQCIHNGFGLHRFKEDLTGVEFAARYADMVQKLGSPYLLNTFVIELHPDRTITAVSLKGTHGDQGRPSSSPWAAVSAAAAPSHSRCPRRRIMLPVPSATSRSPDTCPAAPPSSSAPATSA